MKGKEMSNFFEWFSPGLKLKRWFLLIIIGIILISFSIANFVVKDELSIPNLFLYGTLFICGFASVIMSFVMSQRRILQAIAEANANPNGRNINIKRLLFDKKALDKNIKVVAIGDGAGLTSLLKGLKAFSNNITAIVNVLDNEQKNDDTVPIQDIKKAMTALSNKEEVLEDFFTYKIGKGVLTGQNLGNVFFELINEMCDENVSKSVEYMSKILAMRGMVLPVTLDDLTIGANFSDGTRVVGKRNIKIKTEIGDANISKIFLAPDRCIPASDVIRSIKEADVIVIGPGSLYMGIIPLLLVREVADAIRKSKATKIFVSNIMTEKGQTDNFNLSDYINEIHEHAGKGLFDYVVYAESDIMPEYIRRYNKEGSDVIEADKNNIRDMKLSLVTSDIATVDEKNCIRHDPLKLAQCILKIACDNMDLEDNDKAIEYYTAKSKIKKMTQKDKKKNILFRDIKIISKRRKK